MNKRNNMKIKNTKKNQNKGKNTQKTNIENKKESTNLTKNQKRKNKLNSPIYSLHQEKNNKKRGQISNKKNNLNEIENKYSAKSIVQNTKKTKIKRIFVLILIIIIALIVFYTISLFKWYGIMKNIIQCENSVILDSSGNVIAVIGENRIQKNVDWNKVPNNLKNAYISIEDKTFKSHMGINIKRTGGAILNYVTHRGGNSYGGSTITQQLVKNVTGENETKISRKVVEWDRAIKTEIIFSKDTILNTYFNIIYVGPNIYGVDRGAKYYFDKNVEDLSLAECAFMAGLTHSPNAYNPFNNNDNEERIKNRTCTVLMVMLQEGYISEDDYNKAVLETNSGLKFKKGDVKPNGDGVYSYMSDSVITEVVKDLAENKDISVSFATNYLYLGGLKIYSTQNSSIQKYIEDECKKSQYAIKSNINKGVTSQAAMVIIDHKTGYVVGCSGGLGEKNTVRGFNRATQAVRQTGSSIKPIAVIGPALEENIITAVSIYDDTTTIFEDNYQPDDFDKQLGNITVRRAVESSQNIPFVKIMEQLTSSKSIKYMEKQGITTLTENDNKLPVALGGLDKGISPIQMAGAYACIANDGVYIEPTFYTKIENSKGKIVLKTKQENAKVYSEDTAYILKELLTEPVKGVYGTAKNCQIPGFETAAKTGTTDNFYDKWLCGFTNYYTGVTWFGFDQSEPITEGANSLANQMWANVMKNVHKDLVKCDFSMPASVQRVEICKNSGKIATDNCKDTYIEFFRKGKLGQLETCTEENKK